MQEIVYRPYRDEWLNVTILILASMFALYSVCTASDPAWGMFGVLLILGMLLLAKYMYDRVRMVFCFDASGIRVLRGKNKVLRCVQWKDISYVYYMKTIRGGMIMIFSSEAVDERRLRAMLNWGRTGDLLVIGFDLNQTEMNSQIRLLIAEKVPHTHVFCQ